MPAFTAFISAGPEVLVSMPTASFPLRIVPSERPIFIASVGFIDSPMTPRTPFVPNNCFFGSSDIALPVFTLDIFQYLCLPDDILLLFRMCPGGGVCGGMRAFSVYVIMRVTRPKIV